jgi:glycerophosphoryl diester phosphodiesterase
MWISCWSCGQEVWVETQRECRHCYAIARRCADCAAYEAEASTCPYQEVAIGRHEAQEPTRLSLAFSCQHYGASQEAQSRHAGQAAKAEAAAAAAAAAPAPVAAKEAPASLEDLEVITISREPPLRPPKHPLIIAHRGAPAAAPENTLVAFREALTAGSQAIEFDVHISRDGEPVVIHDATLDRTTNGKGAVADLTLAELKQLDAGSWFGPESAGEKIPTLDEAIAAIPSPELLIVHLRAHSNEDDRCERAVVDAIERNEARKRTIVSHHTRHGLYRLRELDPHLRLCWIPYGGEPGPETIDDAYYMGYRIIQPTLREVDERFVAYAHERGMWINVFWADDAKDMARMIDLGVQGILTNFPERLREVLKHRMG